jgi:hypothetical protein
MISFLSYAKKFLLLGVLLFLWGCSSSAPEEGVVTTEAVEEVVSTPVGVGKCSQLEIPEQEKCINDYFNKGLVAASDFSFHDCAQFSEERGEKGYMLRYNKPPYLSAQTNSLKEVCQTQGAFLLNDISGCEKNHCIELYTAHRRPDFDCNLLNSAPLVSECETMKSDQTALYSHDLALCRTERGFDKFFYNFEQRKFNRDFVKSLNVSSETKSKMFLDDYEDPIVDWEQEIYQEENGLLSSTVYQNALLIDDKNIESIFEEISEEERRVLETVLEKRSKEYLQKSCDTLGSDIECKQVIEDYFSDSN